MYMIKLTKKQGFEMLQDLLAEVQHEHKEALMNLLDNEIEQLNKKNSTRKKKAEADDLKDAVYAILKADSSFLTGAEVLAEVSNSLFPEATQAKVTARLTKLVNEGLIEKKSARIDGRSLMTYKAI